MNYSQKIFFHYSIFVVVLNAVVFYTSFMASSYLDTLVGFSSVSTYDIIIRPLITEGGGGLYYTYITGTFSHANFSHLFNNLVFFIAGSVLLGVGTKKPLKIGLIIVVIYLALSSLYYIVTPGLFLGFSGVSFATLTAGIVAQYKRYNNSAILIILVMFVLLELMPIIMGIYTSTATEIHLIGFISGLISGLFIRKGGN